MSGHSAEEQFVIVADARRRRTAAEKDAIIAELMASGATVSAVARKHNLAPSLLFRWRRQSEGKATTPATGEGRFVPVMFAAPQDGKSTSSAGTSLSCIEIELVGGRRIRVDGSVDVTLLKRLVDALDGR
jgi:transposase